METAFPARGTLAPSILPRPRSSDNVQLPTLGKGPHSPASTIHLSRPCDETSWGKKQANTVPRRVHVTRWRVELPSIKRKTTLGSVSSIRRVIELLCYEGIAYKGIACNASAIA